MAFNPNPFAQARDEVANKSMGEQIAHSGIFHSIRSAFSSGGSAASKSAGLALGVGKLFLALIPVPIVGAIVGAAADAINGRVRSGLHGNHLEQGASNADIAKFGIKELTVENLDRYRWKVAHSFEELNKGIAIYNNSEQNCDDMYNFALLYEQVQRRKQRLTSELQKFTDVINAVNKWIAELENIQGQELKKARNIITQKTHKDITKLTRLVQHNPADSIHIANYIALHAGCTKWCCIKKQSTYDPNTRWETMKSHAGEVANFLLPIAVSSVAVRQSDYTNSADNSKFTA
jgi:hypothetical protein